MRNPDCKTGVFHVTLFALLHQAVQANQQMVRRFIDEYFSKAMDLFLKSRKQFDVVVQPELDSDRV